METIYSNPSASLLFDQQKKQLIQKWKGTSDSFNFRQVIDKSIEFTAGGNIQFIISDTLDQGVVKSEDTKYAAHKTVELFRNGVKKMAFIVPRSALTQLSLNRYIRDTKNDGDIEYFASLNEAEKWLS